VLIVTLGSRFEQSTHGSRLPRQFLDVSILRIMGFSTARKDIEDLFPVEPVVTNPVVPFQADPDRQRLSKLLRGTRWPALTHDFFQRNYEGPISETVSFLTPEGFRYYLPAFICIAETKTADDLAERLLFSAQNSSICSRMGKEQREYYRVFLQNQFGGSRSKRYRDELQRALECLRLGE
jgi:hypothetical protein